MAYRIEYDDIVFEKHMQHLSKRERVTVLDQIPVQLSHEPEVRTRNRFRMKPNSLAGFELRVQHLRVYFDVYTEPEPWVAIRAIGRKDGNVTWIGGERFP